MNLEDLTNQELHKRVLEMGLPNIPITNTTRNVQIKRLRAAIDAQASNNKTRRETIHHVVTVNKTSDDDVKTAAVTAVTKKSAIATATKSSRRATIAAATPKVLVKPAVVPLPVINIDGSSDDDDDDQRFVSKIPQPQKRAPSMGKSEIVTTSFKSISATSPPPPVVEEDTDADDVLVSSGDEQRYNGGGSSSSANTSRTMHFNMRPPIGGKSNVLHRTTVSNTYIAPSYSSSRPSIPHYQSVRNRRTFATASDEADEDEDIDELVQKNSPYLSDFTRRLSRIRAEPLVSAEIPSTTASSGSVYRDYGRPYESSRTPFVRRPLEKSAKVETSVGSTFVTLIRSLDRKYRRFMVPLVFITFVVFIYIMWFM